MLRVSVSTVCITYQYLSSSADALYTVHLTATCIYCVSIFFMPCFLFCMWVHACAGTCVIFRILIAAGSMKVVVRTRVFCMR